MPARHRARPDRSRRREAARASVSGRSFCGDLDERGVGDLGMAADKAARDAGRSASLEHRVQPLGRNIWDRDEDLVRPRDCEHCCGLVKTAEYLDAEYTAASDTRVVVDEADDTWAGRFAELPDEPAPRTA